MYRRALLVLVSAAILSAGQTCLGPCTAGPSPGPPAIDDPRVQAGCTGYSDTEIQDFIDFLIDGYNHGITHEGQILGCTNHCAWSTETCDEATDCAACFATLVALWDE